MLNWFHKLFNPHCSHCEELDKIKLEFEQEKYLRDHICNSCESLKSENNFLRDQNRELLNKLINPSIPIEANINTEELKPLTNYRKPFSVIRQELEAADKLEAARRDKEILEKVAAKPDTSSSIVNEEGKVDIKLVEQELENINKEISNG